VTARVTDICGPAVVDEPPLVLFLGPCLSISPPEPTGWKVSSISLLVGRGYCFVPPEDPPVLVPDP
jgi:hypothetical protein